MEIRNLITFIHVAELNSFTKAAQVLGYSQSTISFQIKQLESELNCMLFERINHNINLTEKGWELFSYAQQIRQLTDEFKESISDSVDISGHVHIVTPDSICEMMLTENYGDFYRRYPQISLKFSTADTDNMFRILDHNEADVIFTLDSHVYHRDYIIAKEEKIFTHFVTGVKSPLAKKKNLSIKDIINYPFILTEKKIGYRRVFDEQLAKMSLEINPVLEIGRTDLIIDTLEKTPGISFLPDFVTDQKVAEGKLVYLNVKDFEIEIWKQLIYHQNKWISKHFEVFINYVMEHEFSW
ncbi:MAG: LysR family transcriptional regulator [Lachnospiraceae bacterium]|nr:LysR family transcriptional regulator [Lachnospiraceae bacterium]